MRHLILSCLLVAVAALPAGAQEAAAPAANCAAFDGVEADGRSQIERRIAEIDAAASAGDIVRFCQASGDLVFLYRSLQAAGASCSAARGAKWAQAAEQSQAALSKACR